MTYHKLWKEWSERLALVSSSAESDFRWLVESATGLRGFYLSLHGNQNINDEADLEKLKSWLSRRAQGEPVAYIIGEWDFYGRSFAVGKGVLVPRPETELIVDIAKSKFSKSQKFQCADFGSGTGCLAITIALEFPQANVVAIEKSKHAVKFLEQNAKYYQLNENRQFFILNKGVEESFHISNTQMGKLDLIVANPPYIECGDLRVEKSVDQFEPREALYSTEKGFSHLYRWLQVASYVLNSGGWFVCEFGDGQSPQLDNYVTKLGDFGSVSFENDFSGKLRVLVAKKL